MKSAESTSGARVALLALGALSLVGGWLIVVFGGFAHAPGVRSTERIFVDGAPAVVMAFLQLAAAALAFTSLLRPHAGTARAIALAFAGAFVPPILYVGFGVL